MSVVASCQFKLARAKKCLEQAYADGDWEAVRRWDTALADSLTELFDTEEYDARALITQLESVLATYSKIMSELPSESTRSNV